MRKDKDWAQLIMILVFGLHLLKLLKTHFKLCKYQEPYFMLSLKAANKDFIKLNAIFGNGLDRTMHAF